MSHAPSDKASHPDWEARFYMAFGTCGIIFGIWVLGYQSMHWLQTGEWLQQNLGTFWDWNNAKWPAFEWRGVQKISDWILRLPLGITSIVIGAMIFSRGMTRLDNERKRRPHVSD